MSNTEGASNFPSNEELKRMQEKDNVALSFADAFRVISQEQTHPAHIYLPELGWVVLDPSRSDYDQDKIEQLNQIIDKENNDNS